MGRPSREDAERIGESILAAATEMFLAEGYGATSIEAIAQHLRISKRTFYHRFKDKAALFEAVVHGIVERLKPPDMSRLFTGGSLEEILLRIGDLALQAATSSQPTGTGTYSTPGSPSNTHPSASTPPTAPGSSHLPRRVRQAHLAPQLRDRVGDADGEYGAAREAERRPEQARSMLAALRDGTRRARAQEEVPMPAWPSAARGDARRRDVPWSAASQEKAPWSGSPRDEAPVADRNTAPSDRRQLPTRPRPTRNTP